MSDPIRLVDTIGGQGRDLLQAAISVPSPPPHALAQTLTSLGLSAAPVAVASSTVGLLKALAIGVIAGTGASAAIVAVQAEESPPPPAQSMSTPAATTVGAKPPIINTTSAPELSARPIPQSLPPKRASTDPTVPTVSPLAMETQLLDRARVELQRGRATAALRILDEHAAGPSRQLVPEAQLLRVQALAKAGNAAAARALGEALLRQHAGDAAYASKVRVAAGLSEP